MLNETEILLEKKLTTDFTMGFELEGVWKDGEADFSEIESFFTDIFGYGGDLHHDGSLDADSEYEQTFEYASPVMPVNVSTFKKIINFYNDHYDREFYVNESCGFHHHISFPGITAEDVVWIMSKLSLDSNMRNKLQFFKDYNFKSGWSETEYLTNLRDAVENLDYRNIVMYCDTDKYSLINVHRNKTLEWRGPRRFMEDCNPQIVKEFYIRVWDFVKWIVDVLDETEINDVAKDNFMEQVRAQMISDNRNHLKGFNMSKKKTNNNLLSDDKVMSFAKQAFDTPSVLFKFINQPQKLEQIIQYMYNKNRLGKRVDVFNNDEEVNPSIIKKLNNICYKYIPYRMLVKYSDSIEEDTLYNTSTKTMNRFLSTSVLDGTRVTDEQKASLLVKHIKSFNPIVFNTDEFMEKMKSGDFYKQFISGELDDILSFVLQFIDDDDATAVDYLISTYFETKGITKDSIITFKNTFMGNNKFIVRMGKYLFRNIFNAPELIIPLYPKNESSIKFLIVRAKKHYDADTFYDTFKPIMIKSSVVTEEEFDEIDKTLVSINSGSNNVDIEYDEDENISYEN